MTQNDPREHRELSNDEVDEVLDRASELDAARPIRSSLTVNEVREIATEAGIDPQSVDQAVHDMARPPGAKGPSTLLGVPNALSVAYPMAIEIRSPELPQIFRALQDSGQLSDDAEYLPDQSAWIDEGVQVTFSTQGPSHLSATADIRKRVTRTLVGSVVGAAWASGGLFDLLDGPASDLPMVLALGASMGLAGWKAYWHVQRERIQSRVKRTAHRLGKVIERHAADADGGT